MDLMTPELLVKIKDWLAEGKDYRCYQLKEWRGSKGIRARAKARDKYCVDCAKIGKLSRIEEVHHEVELKQDPTKFLKLENVVCLCQACHNKRHERFEGERSEEHTSELQSRQYLVCRLLLEKKKK